MEYKELYSWGLTEKLDIEAQAYDGLILARVTEQHRNMYLVVCEDGVLRASVSGKFIYDASGASDFPAVGDWVMGEVSGDTCVIRQILPRKSLFRRRAAGSFDEPQIVAANIDTVFICMGLDFDYNLRRLERYLSIAWESCALPVVVLTKSDICADLDVMVSDAERIAIGAEVIVCSSLTENGYYAVEPYIKQGETIAFIGSSGVGKSTLINRLIGEEALATSETSAGGRGRHTTTSRQLMLLPQGGLVIDTPGMRELGAIDADFEKSFADIWELAERCKFSDCSHEKEPGCAVRAAIEQGLLDEARLENYRKLQSEAGYSGMSSRQIENEKIKRMFGGKNELKQMMREIKKKNHRR